MRRRLLPIQKPRFSQVSSPYTNGHGYISSLRNSSQPFDKLWRTGLRGHNDNMRIGHILESVIGNYVTASVAVRLTPLANRYGLKLPHRTLRDLVIHPTIKDGAGSHIINVCDARRNGSYDDDLSVSWRGETPAMCEGRGWTLRERKKGLCKRQSTNPCTAL